MARRVRLVSAPRTMKERHIRLELAQDRHDAVGVHARVGWDWAGRCVALELTAGSVVDLAYRIRENDHPDFGGIEVEIAGLQMPEL